MTAFFITALYFHLIGAAEVIAGANPDVLRQEDVGTDIQVVDETIVVVCQVGQRERET